MASLDTSLDDMIKKSKSGNRRIGYKPAFVGRTPSTRDARRRNHLGVNHPRPSASTIVKSVGKARKAFWQTDLVEDGLKAAGFSGVQRDTKLYVSNLDSGVTNEDIRDLFSEFGQLIRYGIHYDRNRRPSGSAELIFARRSDAFQALKRYNNVQLDGKPMKIEIIGASAEVPLSARLGVVGGANRKRRTFVTGSAAFQSRSGFNRGFGQRSRDGSNTGRGSGGRGGRGGAKQSFKKKIVEKSADELDKELETYHAEAMQT